MMDMLIQFIETKLVFVIAVHGIITLLLLLLLIYNFRATEKLKDKYRRVLKGSNGKNIEGMLTEYLERAEGVLGEVTRLERKTDILENRLSFSLQRLGMVRYRAFNDTGSDLSYSIALLDEHNDGVVITGIHGRTETISYAKPVKDGKSTYALSVEEQQAIDRAREGVLDQINVKATRSNREGN